VPIVSGDTPVTPADREILKLSNQLLRVLSGHSIAFAMAALAQTFLFTMEEMDELRDGHAPALFQDAGAVLTEIIDVVRDAAAAPTRES
jgi:hypothetical protein